jgi:hypothetical protein
LRARTSHGYSVFGRRKPGGTQSPVALGGTITSRSGPARPCPVSRSTCRSISTPSRTTWRTPTRLGPPPVPLRRSTAPEARTRTFVMTAPRSSSPRGTHGLIPSGIALRLSRRQYRPKGRARRRGARYCPMTARPSSTRGRISSSLTNLLVTRASIGTGTSLAKQKSETCRLMLGTP